MLKFIGDAVLAIFDARTVGDRDACEHAFRAAWDCVEGVAGLEVADGIPLRIGVGVHLGDVVYGNVGGKERLDFTVTGGAVNLASRVEGTCKEARVPLLLTSEVRQHLSDDDLVSIGVFALKGIDAPQALFSLGKFKAADRES